MAFRFNNIHPDIVEELFGLIDTDSLSYREAPVWLNRTYGIPSTKSTIERWHKLGFDHFKERYKKPTPLVHQEIKKRRQEQTKKRQARMARIRARRERRDKTYKDFQEKKKATTEQLKELQNNGGKNQVVLDEEIERVDNRIVKEDNVIWKPNKGPQTSFLSAAETDVLFGGAAGGGKSVAMVVDPLRYAHKGKHKALVLRRTLPELDQLISLSREYYKQAFPGAQYKETKKLWVFPSGATVKFNYLEKEADVYQYQGQDFTWIGFDEITQLSSEWAWNYLASRLRTADPEIETYLRCTANPGGVGHEWVKNRYISPRDPGEAWVYQVNERDGTQLTRRFIPSLLQDNPYLWEDGRYEAMLKSLPEIERRRLLEGDWDVVEGAAFPEFNREVHVLDPFEIPKHWKRTRGVDYGYAAPSCCLWGAIDPQDNTLIIYRELYQKGLTAEELSEKIVTLEANDPPMSGVIDWSVFNRQGYKNTIGHIMNSAPYMLKLKPANKDRKAGKLQIHERLARRNGQQRPSLQILSTCVNTLRELTSIPLKENDPEDVDTHVDDHAYDALRYMVMSLPRIPTVHDLLFSAKRSTSGTSGQAADKFFGY